MGEHNINRGIKLLLFNWLLSNDKLIDSMIAHKYAIKQLVCSMQ